MNNLSRLFLIFAEGETSSTDNLKQSLQNIVTNPIFYVVIGAIVLLIIAVYLLRRIVKPAPGVVKVVVRKGNIKQLVDENSKSYYMVPFKDSLGAVISLSERELSSDKLFVNNGPDALYKINYTLKYKVNDVKAFFPYRESFNNSIISKINDSIREYSDQGHVQEIIKDYRKHSEDLLKLLNTIVKDNGVETTSFKVNYIEPIGNK